MPTLIKIPDFEFSAFYYPEVLEALIQYKRTNVPELTDESEFEPYIQLLRAFALTCHLNNVNIDIVANESTLPTAQLVEQVRHMLALIDYRMSPATPSIVDLVYKLNRVFTTTTEIVNESAQASTAAQVDVPAVTFESNESITTTRTDRLSAVFGEDGGVFTDFTTKANSSTPTVDDWAPWTTPAVGDSVYFCHEFVMWDKLTLTIATPMSGIVGRWEYRDNNYQKAQPDSITQLGGNLEFIVDGYLGTTNLQGTQLRVQLTTSGAYEDVIVVWTGTQNKVTTSLLGQSSPSTTPADYIIGAEWEPFNELVDDTSSLTEDGDVTYSLPQSVSENWTKTTIEGTTGYWMRFRILSTSSPVSPVIRLARIDQGAQYALASATQGLSQIDSALGSSNGTASQNFTASQPNFIDGSETVTVSGVVWTRVDNFLSSRATDEHYVVSLSSDDTAVINFGDGINGKIPSVGVNNISCEYRYGANENGLVGPLSVTVDRAGLTYVSSVYNPRQAFGWAQAQGSTTASLEQAKVLGPSTLRAKSVAVSTTDLATLTQSYINESGAKPFARAIPFEEGFGPKTVELVTVAAGGGFSSQQVLDELALYFNGYKYSTPPVEGKFVANQQVIPTNWTAKNIDIVVTVYGDVEEEEVENSLRNLLQPLALKDDGITYEWSLGGEVPVSRLSHEIFETDNSITKVVISQPTADVLLSNRELPVAGNVSVTVL